MKRPLRSPKRRKGETWPKNKRPELLPGAEALKARRHEMGITAEELADLLGVQWHTVRRWESAQREVPEMALRLLGYIEREARERRLRKAR